MSTASSGTQPARTGRMISATRPVFAGAALAAAFCACATAASAQQMHPGAQVVTKATLAHLWLRAPSQVVADLQPGTKLDVLDKDGDWLWVIVPPDLNGTRRSGWVRADTVETVVIRPATTANEARQELAPPPAAERSANAEDKVMVSVADKHADVSAPSPVAVTPTSFEDVHFDRNQSALRPEDADSLQKMAAALKADPSLVVDIEGHTCDLGTAAYNRALGLRRANEVKDYLVRAGIDESRLHTVSMGKANPQFDNSNEESRKLNRRVALVPEPRR